MHYKNPSICKTSIECGCERERERKTGAVTAAFQIAAKCCWHFSGIDFQWFLSFVWLFLSHTHTSNQRKMHIKPKIKSKNKVFDDKLCEIKHNTHIHSRTYMRQARKFSFIFFRSVCHKHSIYGHSLWSAFFSFLRYTHIYRQRDTRACWV